MNAVWQVLTVWIFIAWVWLTAYTCVQDGWLSTSCIVWAWLTVVPVWKIVWFAGKVIPKNMVLNYISSTTVWKLATTLGKYVDDVARLGKWAKLVKPIKSIDLKHISADHTFWTTIDKSKFLKWANIESVIREWYNKSWRKFLETTSENIYTGKSIKNILIEVDMWKIIWTNAKWNGSYSILRTIVDYEWNILSSFPVATYSIK